MFSSLRARLWLSYALLIWIALSIVALTLLVIFVQNPRLIYPDVAVEIRLAQDQVAPLAKQALQSSQTTLQTALKRESQVRGLSLVVVEDNRTVLGSVLTSNSFPTQRAIQNIIRFNIGQDQIKTILGKDGGTWLFSWHPVNDTVVLLVAAQPPSTLLRNLLRNEIISSFLVAGLVALVLSFLLALWLGGWIARPLRRMAVASQAVARGEYPSVPVQGPEEVRELAHAMNEMSQKVQSSQMSQRDFVANVSHELKTPLTSIQGFAQAIQDGTAASPEELQQAAGIIYDEAGRMNRLVLDLLSLARLEAGTADLQRQPVDMDELLTSLAQKFAPLAQKAQVHLKTDLEAVPVIYGDGDRLAQVFTNLVDNAIKFTPPGGWVVIAARRVESGMQISVNDTGKGIAPEDQRRIFERFYQVDRSRKGGMGRGVGLGLAIARQIVLAHGGQIWVESQPGQGSHFVVKIPLGKPDDPTLVSRSKGKA